MLAEQFTSGRFSERGDVAGFELEAWLVDDKGDPAAAQPPVPRAAAEPPW